MLIGYARVSTEDQNLGLQLDALDARRLRKDLSGRGDQRGGDRSRALNDALGALMPGDVLVTGSLTGSDAALRI